jgi:predicted permease
MDTLVQDIRFALRQIARAPAFSAVAVGLLGLGIGLVAALFTIVQSLDRRPAPGIADSPDLVRIVPMFARAGKFAALQSMVESAARDASYGDFLAFQEQRTVFADVAAWTDSFFPPAVSIDAGDGPSPANPTFVSERFFSLLRLPMALGSGVLPPDDGREASTVVVISHRFWQRVLHGADDVIGKQIRVNEVPFTVVGVAPERFNGADYDAFRYVDVWLPMGTHARVFPTAELGLLSEEGSLVLAARLADGVSKSQAAAVATTIAVRRRPVRPGPAPDGRIGRRWVEVTTLSAAPPDWGGRVPVVYGLYVAMATIILLITCTNVSSMLLGRALGRRHEIGVRLSLGAGRSRVVRQLLTESTVLALLAAAVAFLVLLWVVDGAAALAVPIPPNLTPQWTTFCASLGIALVAGVAFGLLPALHASRTSVSQTLKEGARGHDRRRARLQGAFVVAQLAVTMPLLATAGALVTFMFFWLNRPVGYDTSPNVVAIEIDFGVRRTRTPRSVAGSDARCRGQRTSTGRVGRVSELGRQPVGPPA